MVVLASIIVGGLAVAAILVVLVILHLGSSPGVDHEDDFGGGWE